MIMRVAPILLQENCGNHKEEKLSHNPWNIKTVFFNSLSQVNDIVIK